MGAPGSGKSAYIKQRIRVEKPRRLIIFDPQGEYTEHGRPMATVQGVLEAAKAPAFKVAFQPAGDIEAQRSQFDVLCRIAYAAGDCWLVAEELATVTKAGSAPAGWTVATLKGRHKGMVIFGASQRPAAVDKNFWGNATLIRTGRLNFEGDVKTLANVLAVKPADIINLTPLEFIERDMQTGRAHRGRLKLGGQAPPIAKSSKAGQ